MKFHGFVCCLTGLVLQGCTLSSAPSDSKTVPVKDALLTLEDQLQSTSPVTLGTVGTEEGKKLFSAAVRDAQCKDKAINPLMPVITGPISLQVQGSVTRAGAGAVTATLTPSGTYTYTVTKGQQQQFSVPYSFVPVSGLANFYLSQNVASLANLPEGGPRTKVAASLTDTWTAISTIVSTIMTESLTLNWSDAAVCVSKAPLKGAVVPYFERVPLQLN